MSSANQTMTAKILRRVEAVTMNERGVDLLVSALPATTLGAMPGWLTGESFADQGVEVTMPNLPRDISLPELSPSYWRIRVESYGPRTARIVTAPEGSRVFQEEPSWLGIVTRDRKVPVNVSEDSDTITVRAKEHTVVLTRFPLTVKVLDAAGNIVLRTSERMRQVAGFPLAPPLVAHDAATSINLELAATESVTGFGEQFGRLVKNGQRLTLRCDDALGTGTGLTYKPVPVWHSNAGYAGFLNTGAVTVADVGHEKPSVFSITARDEAIDLFIFVSRDPAQRLADYTDLTGKSHVPPLWAFGYWMGRCRYHSKAEMLEVSRKMNTHDIPCDVLHLDPDWLVTDRLNTDFVWNTERFGSRRDFVSELADSGRRLSLWELPYVDPGSPRYAELEQSDYLVKTPDGKTAQLAGTPTPDGRPRALVDFYNDNAREWWRSEHKKFIDDGVAVFKTDFGEGFPPSGTAADGTPRAHLHNLYPLRYNATTSDAVAEFGDNAPLVWGRSGWAGSHRYPGQWGGDAESSPAGMQATVRGGLSYALSAPGFWSHDIGGFYGPELTPGLYVRWTQLGAFSPLMRAHGLRPREPWEFGDAALSSSRLWIRRRYALLPYLWQAAHRSVEEGLPMMRPLSLEFPSDPIVAGIDSEFLLGDSLLVVPIFDDSMEPTSRQFYVPSGTWSDFYSGQTYVGGQFYTVRCSIDEMPVLVREGSVIPTIALEDGVRNVDQLVQAPWTAHVFGTPRTTTLVDFSGELKPLSEFSCVMHV